MPFFLSLALILNVTRSFVSPLLKVTRFFVSPLLNVTRSFVSPLLKVTRSFVSPILNATRFFVSPILKVTRFLLALPSYHSFTCKVFGVKRLATIPYHHSLERVPITFILD